MASWAKGSELVRAAARKPDSLLSRFRRWWGETLRNPEYHRIPLVETFKIGDRVRIDSTDPGFSHQIGTEATVASELERGDNGRWYYRLDNNMSAEPECLKLIEHVAESRGSME